LYYPWGDAQWRPYLSIGFGAANFYFRDTRGVGINQTLVALPYGAGTKYYLHNWLALRLAVMDNWAIGTGGLDTMHNISLDFGLEVRFGGMRRKYRH
jgi:hypothetical protein